MSNLTIEERKWIKKVQKALDSCPSDRMGFSTIGDRDVAVYDLSKHEDVFADMDKGMGNTDFRNAVDNVGANFGQSLNFPSPVESVAG